MVRQALKHQRDTKRQLAEGRLFKTKPGKAFLDRFRKHIAKFGSPIDFPGLCWTKPEAEDVPKPLMKFATPETLRKRVPMSPCPICSADSPKYYEGLLCWSPQDERVRAIGHECGHDFFSGDSFAAELDEFAEAAKEATARAYLAETYRRLPEFVLRARWMAKEFDSLIRARDDLVATVTKRAIDAALKSQRPNGELTVEFASSLRDGQGKLLVDQQVVSRGAPLLGFRVTRKARGALAESAKWAGGALVVQRDPHPLWRTEPSQHEILEAADRRSLAELERRCREFISLVESVEADVAALRASLSNAALYELSRWGTHLHAPTPFWIQCTTDQVTAGKGPHIRASGRRIHGLPISDT